MANLLLVRLIISEIDDASDLSEAYARNAGERLTRAAR